MGAGLGQRPKLQPENIFDGTPSIREHMMAWWEQDKEHEKKESNTATQETGVRSSRAHSLPDSLFLSEPEVEFEDSSDEAATQEFDESVQGIPRHQLEPGDVLLAQDINGRRRLALYLGHADSQAQLLLPTGRFMQRGGVTMLSDVIKKFASAEEIAPIKELLPVKHIMRQNMEHRLALNYMGPVPDSNGVEKELTARLAKLQREMIEFKRGHAGLLDTLYERLAEEDRYVFIHVDEFMHRLLGDDHLRLRNAARLCISAVADKNPAKTCLSLSADQSTLHVLLGPKNLVKRFGDVVEWTREYQELAASAVRGTDVKTRLENNPIGLFIRKAQRIITKSRSIRSPTTIGCIGPSTSSPDRPGSIKQLPSGQRFTEKDISILEFVWDTHIRKPAALKNKHHAISSVILRAIGAYPKMVLEDKIGRLLLQEVGAMAPWAASSDDNVMFPIPGRKGAHATDELLRISKETIAALQKNAGDGQALLQDSMVDIRGDFGLLEALCIDSTDTTIRDDAFSLEPCEGRPGCHWIHIHIAHPSAHFDQASIFGRLARNLQSSWYTSFKNYHMLPDAIGLPLSLKPGAPVLTVSTLLNESGELLDVKVRPMRLNNVINIDTKAVQEVMHGTLPESFTLIVGGDPTVSRTAVAEVSEIERAKAKSQAPVLKKILALMDAYVQRKRRSVPDVLNVSMTAGYTKNASVNFVEEYRSDRLHESVHYQGDPTITYFGDLHTHQKMSAEGLLDNVVGSMMTLAGESAARWMKERNIPGVFTVAKTHPAYPIRRLNKLDTAEDAFMLLPRSVESEEPGYHVTLTAEQYMRYTSPLRRFGDLLSHWNTDAYIRAVAKGEIEDGAPIDESTFEMPWPRAQIRQMLSQERWVIKEGFGMQTTTTQHLGLQALFRAFHFKEAELPELFDVERRGFCRLKSRDHPEATQFLGATHPFGFECQFLRTKEKWESEAKRGQFLPTKIEIVDVTENRVLVRAVGPATDKPTYLPAKSTVYQSKERRLAAEGKTTKNIRRTKNQ